MSRHLVVAVTILASTTVACGSSKSSSGGGDGGPPTYSSNAPSTGCGATSLEPGTSTVTLMSGGLARTYVLHVPPGYTGKPTPLVINMHGFLSNATQQEGWSEMNTVADSENFIVAYPNGAGSPQSWNAGSCCEFTDTTRDDVAFISSVIDDVGGNGCVALDRVYATGMSNGGFMSHNLGCNLSDRIAAIGPVSGVLGVAPEDCHPGRAIPVMEFHGTADPLVPYDGGSPSSLYWSFLYPGQPEPLFASVAETVSFWQTTDGCQATPQQTYSNGDATCETYSGCQGGAVVTICTLDGDGHTWPGGNISALGGSVVTSVVGKTSTSINASSALWTFFKGYQLPMGFDGGVTVAPPYVTFGSEMSDAGGGGTGDANVDVGMSDAASDSPADAPTND